jgi:hypothetical protein
MNALIKRKNIIILIILPLIISSSNSKLNNENKLYNDILSPEYSPNKIGYNYFRSLETATCASTSYDKKEIQEECEDGPSSYDRVLKYGTFQVYISDHDYHSNGLNYVTSLFVDSDTHHFGNFMNDGVGMIILYIIDGLMLIAWVPLLCCWKKRCCIFDECLYEDDCCIIFWHILTYFLAAAILSFIIVVLCFGE